jgi:hypothetical protein
MYVSMYVYVSKCQQINELLRKNSKKKKKQIWWEILCHIISLHEIPPRFRHRNRRRREEAWCALLRGVQNSSSVEGAGAVAVAGVPEFVVAGSSRARHGASKASWRVSSAQATSQLPVLTRLVYPLPTPKIS